MHRLVCCCVAQMFEYGRSGNPTRNVLEKVLASLEGAKYGEHLDVDSKCQI